MSVPRSSISRLHLCTINEYSRLLKQHFSSRICQKFLSNQFKLYQSTLFENFHAFFVYFFCDRQHILYYSSSSMEYQCFSRTGHFRYLPIKFLYSRWFASYVVWMDCPLPGVKELYKLFSGCSPITTQPEVNK